MDWTEAARHWPALTEALATRWPALDRDDISAVDGDRTRMNVLLGRVLKLSPREAEEEIDAFLAGPMPSDAIMAETEDDARIRASAAHIPPGEDVYSEDADFGDDRLSDRPMGRHAAE